jgi:hypothetical protein
LTLKAIRRIIASVNACPLGMQCVVDGATFKVAGQRWQIVYGDPGRKNLGVCLYGLRRIVIRRGLTKAEEVGVVMHEAIHAGGYYLNEEAVETIEYAIMGALKATGNLPCED